MKMSEKMMLCESIKESEIENLKGNYKANLKYDGERILAIKEGKEVMLINRRGREKSWIYPEIARELKRSNENFILDGEVITDDGLFNSLQHRSNLGDREKIKRAEKENPVKFMVFDVLKLNGESLTNLPLKKRISYWGKISFELVKPIDIRIWLVEYDDINNMLMYAIENNREGIVIKDMDSIYEFRRSKSWLKLKLWKEIEVEFSIYEGNNAGVKLISDEVEVQVQDDSSDRVERIKEKIDRGEKVKVLIQYLEKTRENRLRFPSCREVLL